MFCHDPGGSSMARVCVRSTERLSFAKRLDRIRLSCVPLHPLGLAHTGVGNVNAQHIEYDGLRRAARLAASIAGATGVEVDEVADEAMARLLMQDGLVNNPKAWVRRTA